MACAGSNGICRLAREAVARSAGDDAERRQRLSGAAVVSALHERARHLVDRAVAAPRDDELGAGRSGLHRQLVRMSGALGQPDVRLRVQPFERARRERRRARRRSPAVPARTRD